MILKHMILKHMIPEHIVKKWISGFGVPVPVGVTASDPAAVTAAAAGLTPPLVVKAYGAGLLHKSEAGAVRGSPRSPRPMPWRCSPNCAGRYCSTGSAESHRSTTTDS